MTIQKYYLHLLHFFNKNNGCNFISTHVTFFQLGQGVSLQVDKLDKPDFTQRVSFDENIELCEAQETVSIGYIIL